MREGAKSFRSARWCQTRATARLTMRDGLATGGPQSFGRVGNHFRRVFFLFDPRSAMKIRNSLKSLKDRHRDCRVIRRRGRTYVINKTNRRFKARQG